MSPSVLPALLLSLSLVGGAISCVPPLSAAAAHRDSTPLQRHPISATEFAQRRQQLVALVRNVPTLVLSGGEEPHSLFYLTGYQSPSQVALLLIPFKDSIHAVLFLDSLGSMTQWNGQQWSAVSTPMPGIQHRPVAEFEQVLKTVFPTPGRLIRVGYVMPNGVGQRISQVLDLQPNITVVSKDTREVVNPLRAIKSPTEQALIRQAVTITNDAHQNILAALRPGMLEGDVKKLIDSVYRSHGADKMPGFTSIVASGPNSTDLHYNGSDRMLKAGEHVKIDIGARYGGYVADVTRTYPVTGTFSTEQRAIYQIVREAQAAAEAMARPGASWSGVMKASNDALAAGLTRLGLIESPTATYACRGGQCPQLSLFFFHGLGHGLGLEVHDPYRGLVIGSAFVIEPGIYVRPAILDELAKDPLNQAFVDRIRPAVERYRDIGVRIEDAYLITKDGLEWMSKIPRDIDEVEAAMAKSRKNKRK